MVSLTGKLFRKTYPGPPNYADTHNGDKPETYWLLQLDGPICMRADKSQPDLNPAKKNVKTIQLVISSESYQQYRSLLDERVTATGTLFTAETGHHHTPVLLKLRTLQPAK